jgi:hypothetical protein
VDIGNAQALLLGVAAMGLRLLYAGTSMQYNARNSTRFVYHLAVLLLISGVLASPLRFVRKGMKAGVA